MVQHSAAFQPNKLIIFRNKERADRFESAMIKLFERILQLMKRVTRAPDKQQKQTKSMVCKRSLAKSTETQTQEESCRRTSWQNAVQSLFCRSSTPNLLLLERLKKKTRCKLSLQVQVMTHAKTVTYDQQGCASKWSHKVPNTLQVTFFCWKQTAVHTETTQVEQRTVLSRCIVWDVCFGENRLKKTWRPMLE